jgi:hypothetical protein
MLRRKQGSNTPAPVELMTHYQQEFERLSALRPAERTFNTSAALCESLPFSLSLKRLIKRKNYKSLKTYLSELEIGDLNSFNAIVTALCCIAVQHERTACYDILISLPDIFQGNEGVLRFLKNNETYFEALQFIPPQEPKVTALIALSALKSYEPSLESAAALSPAALKLLRTYAFISLHLVDRIEKYNLQLRGLLSGDLTGLDWGLVKKMLTLTGDKLSEGSVSIKQTQSFVKRDYSSSWLNNYPPSWRMASSNRLSDVLLAFLRAKNDSFLNLKFPASYLFPENYVPFASCAILLYQLLNGHSVCLNYGRFNRETKAALTKASPFAVKRSLTTAEAAPSARDKLNLVTYNLAVLFKNQDKDTRSFAQIVTGDSVSLSQYNKVHCYKFLGFVKANKERLTPHLLTMRFLTNPPTCINAKGASEVIYAKALLAFCTRLAAPAMREEALAEELEPLWCELTCFAQTCEDFKSISSGLVKLTDEEVFTCVRTGKPLELDLGSYVPASTGLIQDIEQKSRLYVPPPPPSTTQIAAALAAAAAAVPNTGAGRGAGAQPTDVEMSNWTPRMRATLPVTEDRPSDEQVANFVGAGPAIELTDLSSSRGPA